MLRSRRVGCGTYDAQLSSLHRQRGISVRFSLATRVKMPGSTFAILPVRFPQSHTGYVERRAQTKEVDAYNPNELVCSHRA
jgi:hypothetical protein